MVDKFCKYCGNELEEDSIFCSSCGEKIGIVKTVKASEPVKPVEVSEPVSQGLTYDEGEKKTKKKKKKKRGCFSLILKLFLGFIIISAVIGYFLDSSSSDDYNPDLEDYSDFDENDNYEDLDVDESLPEYTFMVFLNGSDLESYYDNDYGDYSSAGTIDIVEMAAVGSTDDVNVIIETGGTAYWNNETIDPNQNQRYKVVKDDIELLGDLGLKNIGDPQTLIDFIVWTVNEYPAQKYVLDLWNHGGGPIYGYGSDEHYTVNIDGVEYNEHLTLEEIEYALKTAYDQTGVKFEVIGFDACLMATVEVALMVSPYAKYLVASEEFEPGHGWDYTGILSALTSDPDMNGKMLGKVISDTFLQHAYDNYREDMITLSVTDLSKIESVINALVDLSSELEFALDNRENVRTISGSRKEAEAYGVNNPMNGYSEIIDLYDFAYGLGTQEASVLMEAIKEAVVYKVVGPKRQYGGGLSIYFPYMERAALEDKFEEYLSVDFLDPYESFLGEFIAEMYSDNRSVSLESRSPSENDDGSFSIVIDENDRDELMTIYNVVGLVLDEEVNSILSFGYDSDIYYDEETGVITDNFSGYWTGINGEMVTIYLLEENDDYNLYTVPAYVNDVELDIICTWTWDDDLETGGYYDILGGWEVGDDDSLMSEKDFVEIKQGDRIRYIYSILDFVENEEYLYEGDEIILTEEPYMDFVELPSGEQYLYGFYLVDYAQNGTYSDFVVFNLYD